MNNHSVTEPLNLENTCWTNTIVATGRIYGLVAYTGKETRIALNSKEPRSKFG
jgi:phospholipid-translocating ATPase